MPLKLNAWGKLLIDALLEAEYGNGSMSDTDGSKPVTREDLRKAIDWVMRLLGLDRVVLIEKLTHQTERLSMRVSELKAVFDGLNTGIDALNTEAAKIATEVQTLKDSLGGDLDPDTQASLDRLSANVATLTTGLAKVDQIIPDAPPTTPTTPG